MGILTYGRICDLASKFEEYGFQAEMVPFQAHLTYPKEMFVHVLSPIR